VGLWQPKVLPWVKRSNDSWIPEVFALQIGDQLVQIRPDKISNVRESVLEAIQSGRETVSWEGIQIPATSQTIKSLDSLISETYPSRPKMPDGQQVRQSEPTTPVVLQIVDNLCDLGFERAIGKSRKGIESGLPNCIRSAPKPHQQEGLAWLQQAWLSGEPGVLLADDMGFGKTLQTLAFMAWVREAMKLQLVRAQPLLVVAPTGLLSNWRQEHDQHLYTPGLGDPLCAFGAGLGKLRQKRGREVELGESLLDSEQLLDANWILTTYETMRDYQHSFAAVPFGLVVFDEMQKIKTPGTVMTHAAKALNADFIIGLTGTPIENRLADLWCLVDTLQPGQLGDLTSFSRTYEKGEEPDKLRNLRVRMTQPRQTSRVNGDTDADHTNFIRPPMMMRRMKADRLKGLPEKFEHPVDALMPEVQAQAYDKAILAARSGESRAGILEALHRMRSISLHPIHPEQATDDEAYVRQSARLTLAVQVLDNIAKAGEKALVFLESREMQPSMNLGSSHVLRPGGAVCRWHRPCHRALPRVSPAALAVGQKSTAVHAGRIGRTLDAVPLKH
jgi:SNF2 family DNA or RNA helicase